MRNANSTALMFVAALLATPAAAQENERYTLERQGDRFVRMDRRSGEMSICAERSGELVCRLAADEREAFNDELERLQAQVDALEERVEAIEAQPPASASELPDEETFDQALGLMERFFRRFMGIVRDLEREFDEPEPATPQRT